MRFVSVTVLQWRLKCFCVAVLLCSFFAVCLTGQLDWATCCVTLPYDCSILRPVFHFFSAPSRRSFLLSPWAVEPNAGCTFFLFLNHQDVREKAISLDCWWTPLFLVLYLSPLIFSLFLFVSSFRFIYQLCPLPFCTSSFTVPLIVLFLPSSSLSLFFLFCAWPGTYFCTPLSHLLATLSRLLQFAFVRTRTPFHNIILLGTLCSHAKHS